MQQSPIETPPHTSTKEKEILPLNIGNQWTHIAIYYDTSGAITLSDSGITKATGDTITIPLGTFSCYVYKEQDPRSGRMSLYRFSPGTGMIKADNYLYDDNRKKYYLYYTFILKSFVVK